MWKLHRYYLKELAAVSAITFLVLFSIVLISLVARGIQRAQGGGLFDAALIMLFWAMDAFPHLLPIAFLLATVLVFARAVQDRELVAIRSAGISPRVPMNAAVLLGIVLTVVGSLCMHYVIPDVHFRKYRIVAEVFRSVIQNLKLGGDRIPLLDTGFVLTFRQRGEFGEFRDCTLYVPEGRRLAPQLQSPILFVDQVAILVPEAGGDELTIRLQGIRDPLDDPSSNQVVGEVSIALPLHDIVDKDRRTERDEDLGSDQLLAEVLRGVHPEPTAAWYTLLRRSCFALLPLLLAPLGFCIATFARDRGRVVALLFALLPLAVFYGSDVAGAKVLVATDQPLAGLLPALSLSLLGVPFCWRELRR